MHTSVLTSLGPVRSRSRFAKDRAKFAAVAQGLPSIWTGPTPGPAHLGTIVRSPLLCRPTRHGEGPWARLMLPPPGAGSLMLGSVCA